MAWLLEKLQMYFSGARQLQEDGERDAWAKG